MHSRSLKDLTKNRNQFGGFVGTFCSFLDLEVDKEPAKIGGEKKLHKARIESNTGEIRSMSPTLYRA